MAGWNPQSTPIVIISRDRLSPLKQLLAWLDEAGYTRPVVVDNASTFQPLVEFLDQLDVEVIRLDRNVGHLAPWLAEEARSRLPDHEPFVVSDCDVVPDDGCPGDVVEHLGSLLIAQKGIDKAGLGLRIDDLPDSYPLKQEVVQWESRFWEREVSPGVFDAEVDTTFALYRSPSTPHSTTHAVRTGPPYIARHLSWYSDPGNLSEEQLYYREHADPALSHWEAAGPSDELAALLRLRTDEIATRKVVLEDRNPFLKAWLEEPELTDEKAYTPWADPGWHAWNGMSPELEFAEFAGALVQLLCPAAVVETGVGQGYVTRRLAAKMGGSQRLLAFEEDDGFRRQLERLPFFAKPGRSIGAEPTAADLAEADLTILDSELPIRFDELDRWAEAAPPGAILLVHDASASHGPEAPHGLIRKRIEDLGIEGSFLRNPRGGFLGFKPVREPELRKDLERQMATLNGTRSLPILHTELKLRRSRLFNRARGLLRR